MPTFQPPRGMRDLGPRETAELLEVVDVLTSCVAGYGFRLVQTPVLEPVELFEIKSGAEIRDQMYTLIDKGGRELALRPDITPSLTRYYGASCQSEQKPVRLAARDRVWRYENPQAGRYREINQFNAEQFGGTGPLCDAELVAIFVDCLESIGLPFELQLGDRRILADVLTAAGIPSEEHLSVVRILDKADKVARPDLLSELRALERSVALSPDAEESLADFAYLRGPIDRILPLLAARPISSVLLSAWMECRDHLDAFGVLERCVLRPGLARGSDYYNGILMEAVSPNTLGIGAIGGGGRYDDLPGLYGYPSIAATGFSIGLDRVVLLRLDAAGPQEHIGSISAVVGFISPEHANDAAALAASLRARGIGTELLYEARSAKKVEDYARRRGARWSLVAEGPSGQATLFDHDSLTRQVGPALHLVAGIR